MAVEYTEAQKRRLRELSADSVQIDAQFEDAKERESTYKKVESQAVDNNRNIVNHLIEEKHMPDLCSIQNTLAQALCEKGFTQVSTPTIISRKFLERMTIDGTHPLNNQVFWLDDKSCLRPMLAPNLYDISKNLINIHGLPLRIFEIGSCFRKESEGHSHLKEFTMLNVVEWGTPMEERTERLKEIAQIVLDAAQIDDYHMVEEDSVVYGRGLDIVGNDDMELASTSMGPHLLDDQWKMTCTWVGIGFGIERLLMYKAGQGIHCNAKSISYLDGARLNIK